MSCQNVPISTDKNNINTINNIDSLYNLAKQTKNDSLLNSTLKSQIKINSRKKNWDLFHKYRKEHLLVTARIGDTTSFARTLEYTGEYYRKTNKIDSAYYYYTQSLELYKATQDSLNIGFGLLNLAIIEKNLRDYSVSIYNLKQSLLYMKGKAKPRRISSSYNSIGNNYINMKMYDSALVYLNKSLEIRKNLNNSAYFIQSLNNIGSVYKNKGNYKKALEYFNKALDYNEVLVKYPKTKATLIDNRTHSLFLIDKSNKTIKQNLLDALAIRNNVDDSYGKAVSYIHLAEFYKFHLNYSKAKDYLKKALKVTENINHHKSRLNVLELQILLSEGKEKEKVLNYYSHIRDSLDFADKLKLSNLYAIKKKAEDKDIVISSLNQSIKHQWINLKTIVGLLIILLIVFSLFIYKKRKERKLFKRELDKRKLQVHAMKGHHSQNLSEEYIKGFHHTLKIKYKLSKVNIEFWEIHIKNLSQKEQLELLGIKKDTLNKRRFSLKQKIEKKREIKYPNFTSKIALRIYRDEELLFENVNLKK
jgi:tetratricopeptide (TPR) repeat protein